MSAPARATPALTALLVALVAFGPMSVDIYLPSLPEMTHVFATDVSGTQLTLSVFAATLAAAQLIYGPLSDRYGRRPILLGGMVIYTIGGVLCGLAVKMNLWKHRFARGGGGPNRRMEFVKSEILPGLSHIKALEQSARTGHL